MLIIVKKTRNLNIFNLIDFEKRLVMSNLIHETFPF